MTAETPKDPKPFDEELGREARELVAHVLDNALRQYHAIQEMQRDCSPDANDCTGLPPTPPS